MKLKAIATGDLHLDINNRLEDIKEVLRQMMTYAVKNKIDIVYILGDIYDRNRPYNLEQTVFAQFIKFLVKNGIKVVIISGNHDTDRFSASTMDSLRIIDLPGVSVLKNPSTVDFGQFQLFLGHFLVQGAKLGPLDYSAHSPVSLQSILGEYKADIYLLGDVHKAQKLNDNPPVLYVGSPERMDFGERKEIKGFTLLEANEKLTYKFIPLKTRPMKQYDVNNYHEWLVSDLDTEYKEAIIKVKISCTQDVYNTINEPDIFEKLDGAKSIKVEYEITSDDRVRNEDITESCSPKDAFNSYAQEVNLDKDTIKLGLKLMRETDE